MKKIAIVLIGALLSLCLFGCSSGGAQSDEQESKSVDKTELIEIQQELYGMTLDKNSPPGIAAEVYKEEIAVDIADTSLSQSDVDLKAGVYAELIALNITSKIGPSSDSKSNPESKSGKDANVSISKQNALRSAKSYLGTMPFSYTGLIGQLEYEQYSTADATYAADNCGADWNVQAEKAAKSYIELMPFSRGELIDQLKYEGYTDEQAMHGADSVGL